MDMCDCGFEIPPEAGACPSCGKPYLPLRSGTMIGRYQIQKVLGQGGFGITYQSSDTLLGRTVAIKEVAPQGSWRVGQDLRPPTDLQVGWDSFLDDSQSEARNLADLERLGDPGIVTVHDILRANNTLYIVMEYVDGSTLYELITSVPFSDDDPPPRLPEAQILDIAARLCRTLDVIHEHGIVHRDIKPDNIILAPGRGPVLIDFGIAKKTDPGAKSHLATGRGYTPGYAPREQIEGGRIGSYTDVYSLGATLYVSVMGKVPASSTTRSDYMESGEADPLKPISGISAPLSAAVMAALSLDRRDRPQTGSDFMNAVYGVIPGPVPEAAPNTASATVLNPHLAQPPVTPAPGPQVQPGPGPLYGQAGGDLDDRPTREQQSGSVPPPPEPGPTPDGSGRRPRRRRKSRGILIAVAVIVVALVVFGVVEAIGSPHKTASSTTTTTGTGTSTTTGSTTPVFTPAVYLDQLTPVSGQTDSTGIQTVGGKDVSHGVAFNVSSGTAEQAAYDIRGRYTKLTVQLGIGDQFQNPAHADILGDGTSLLNGGVDLVPNGELISEAISVAGVKTLTLVATTSQQSYAQVVFGNPLLTAGAAPTSGTTTPTATALPATTSVWLDSLQPSSGNADFTGPFAVGGKDVPHGVGFEASQGQASSATYDIGGRYAQMSVDLAIGDQFQNPAHLDILGDNGQSLLGGGVDVVPNGEMIAKTVNVTGVQHLTLVATTNQNSYAQAIFGEPLLIPAGGSAAPTRGGASTPASAPAYLDQMNPIHGSTDFTGTFSVGGHPYSHGVGFEVAEGQASYATYHLGGHYKQLRVVLAIGDQFQNPGHVDILGDGWSLLDGGIDLQANGQVVTRTIDVTGIHDLTLVATTDQQSYSQVMFGSAEVLP